MILAAGRGDRLRPLTDTIPKPLIQVGPHALIEHHLLRLASAGLTDIVINLGWLGEQISDRLGDGSRYGVGIRYSQEPPGALETAGGIRHALAQLGDQPFLVVSADVVTDFPFDLLIDFEPVGLGHLVLVDNPPHHPEGDFGLERAQVNRNLPRYTFSGIGVFQAHWFQDLKPGPRPLRPLFERAIDQGQLTGQHYDGLWLDVGTPDRLTVARKHYANPGR